MQPSLAVVKAGCVRLCRVASNIVCDPINGKRHPIVLSWDFPLRIFRGFNFLNFYNGGLGADPVGSRVRADMQLLSC